MKLLFVSSKVERRITALEKSGKYGTVVAQKASDIISNIESGDRAGGIDRGGSYTKYGEKRIKNCRKYDLGGGYRLIMLRRDKTIFIPFLGSHDECQRWLENYSRLKEYQAGKGRTIQIDEQSTYLEDSIDHESTDVDGDPDGFLHNLTDKDLRTVFSGLVEGAGKLKG